MVHLDLGPFFPEVTKIVGTHIHTSLKHDGLYSLIFDRQTPSFNVIIKLEHQKKRAQQFHSPSEFLSE